MIQKFEEEGCSFCNGKETIKSLIEGNSGRMKIYKTQSIIDNPSNIKPIIDIFITGDYEESDFSTTFYSAFNINFCPMCGCDVQSKFKNRNV